MPGTPLKRTKNPWYDRNIFQRPVQWSGPGEPRVTPGLLYNLDLPAALACFQRALARAERRALPAGLTFRLGLDFALAGAPALCRAQRARAAAEMAARPAALIRGFLFRPPGVAAAGAGAPSNWWYCSCSVWIRSWMSAALRNCRGVSSVNDFIFANVAIWPDKSSVFDAWWWRRRELNPGP